VRPEFSSEIGVAEASGVNQSPIACDGQRNAYEILLVAEFEHDVVINPLDVGRDSRRRRCHWKIRRRLLPDVLSLSHVNELSDTQQH